MEAAASHSREILPVQNFILRNAMLEAAMASKPRCLSDLIRSCRAVKAESYVDGSLEQRASSTRSDRVVAIVSPAMSRWSAE